MQATLANHAMKFQTDSTQAMAAFSLSFLVLGMLVGWSWRGRAGRTASKALPALAKA